MDKDKLAAELLATFVDELENLVAALNRDLLVLERGESPERAEEVLHSLFRTAHTIKGASRAAGAPLIQRRLHELAPRAMERGFDRSDGSGERFGDFLE